MKFTKIPEDTFKTLQVNAGIIVKNFNVKEGTFEMTDFITATTGGITVDAKPTFEDFGADIDNCPKNTKELKRITEWEVKVSATALAVSEESIQFLLGAADKDTVSGAIKPRNDLKMADFQHLWFLGDLADNGYVAIKILNGLSTGGFSLKTSDKGKGNISMEITGHTSMDAQDVVPVEFYVSEGTEESGDDTNKQGEG